jgi:hypothetical protein
VENNMVQCSSALTAMAIAEAMQVKAEHGAEGCHIFPVMTHPAEEALAYQH